jgi:hypothetical protein
LALFVSKVHGETAIQADGPWAGTDTVPAGGAGLRHAVLLHKVEKLASVVATIDHHPVIDGVKGHPVRIADPHERQQDLVAASNFTRL